MMDRRCTVVYSCVMARAEFVADSRAHAAFPWHLLTSRRHGQAPHSERLHSLEAACKAKLLNTNRNHAAQMARTTIELERSV